MNLEARPGTLGRCRVGFRGRVVALRLDRGAGEPPAVDDLERRLLEMGFVEGARVELLHQGWLGGDPIAVRVDDATVALRRRDAASVLVAEENAA